MTYNSNDYRNDVRQIQKDSFWTLGRALLLIIVLGVIGVGLKLLFTPAALIEKATDPDHIITNYEEFQTLYNTCQKINTDLGTIRGIPDDDASFKQFSKAQQIAAKKQQLSRWVEEYNAKSKMINRNLWKSSALPYQLNVNDFSRFDQ